WQDHWEKNRTNITNLSKTDKKLYHLNMYIYPSGAKLHCGHWFHYGPSDSWSRYKKLKGFNVFEPMGYDAFGLPAENYAIKTGIHPQDSTLKNIEEIRIQMKRMGAMYDWDAELMTCSPEYYKWNQWMFLQLYKKGLAYRKAAPVNWCPSCQTVLANEQVESDGSCERCGTTVIQKHLTQWFFKITHYAEELLQSHEKIDYPEKTRLMQINWIGKSIGADVKFKIDGHEKDITVFTTRPDTLFGATYMVLAPELELVDQITTDKYKKDIEKYRDSIKSMTEIDRTSTTKEKTGIFTGAYAINPVTNKKIPIWIADYVLMTYGTGAIMAVPGQDERDWEFAEKFNLPILRTVQPPDDFDGKAFLGDGPAINSDFLNGLYVDDAKKKIIKWLEEKGIGESKVNYKLRDWLISRQRYWGTPIPIIYCDKCGEVPIPEKDLPVELPYNVNFKPDGGSPLASCKEFVNTTCPNCGGKAKRDVDTMDTFVDSSWYYLRFLSPHYDKGMFDVDLANKWLPVDMYVGGTEHATGHLMFYRFFHKFLRDIGMLKSDEPVVKLVHQGTVTNQGAKMSKSRGNVVNPDPFMEKYGADVFRMYLMFMGPYEMGGDWSDTGIVGIDRFVQRVYALFSSYKGITKETPAPDKFNIDSLADVEKNIYKKINQTVSKVDSELEHFRFNTAIAMLMELLNEMTKNFENCRRELIAYTLERFAVMISPLAPHFGEECWQIIGYEKSIFDSPVWFEADAKALAVDEVTIVVQVSGKVRGKVTMPVDSKEADVKKAVWNDEGVKRHTEGKQVVKEIYVPNKIYNIVVK
ncbi:MAG: leucine--tRNA ligase, partial [Ignavibacteria bacterium RBG_13_36_8]